jgi:predicted lactoylglutathione lyase
MLITQKRYQRYKRTNATNAINASNAINALTQNSYPRPKIPEPHYL